MSDRARIEMGGHSSRRLLPVALLLSLSCASAQEAANPQPAPAKPAPLSPQTTVKPADGARRIDLYLGSARELLPASRWETIAATQPTDSAEEGDLPSLGHNEDVQVQGSRPAPNVPGGIGGLFWAMRHPTQAWRIFVPAPTQ